MCCYDAVGSLQSSSGPTNNIRKRVKELRIKNVDEQTNQKYQSVEPVAETFNSKNFLE